MKICLACLILLTLLFMACNSDPDKKATVAMSATQSKTIRYGMVTGVKAEKLDHYKKLHASPWPAVVQKISACNIKNYSIYLKKIEGNYFLFSYFEYTGNNFKDDMKKMAADTTTQRWWKETDPCQLPLKEATEKGEVWTAMEEIFHQQ